MGIAAAAEKNTPASASVFYDRVEELAKGGAVSLAVILGQATAHEIGHLLLGSNSPPIGNGGDLLFTPVSRFFSDKRSTHVLGRQAGSKFDRLLKNY